MSISTITEPTYFHLANMRLEFFEPDRSASELLIRHNFGELSEREMRIAGEIASTAARMAQGYYAIGGSLGQAAPYLKLHKVEATAKAHQEIHD